MQLSFKKVIFILLGLAIISVGFFFGKLNTVQASLKEGQKFEDWSVSCIKDENKKQTCLLNQQYQITKDGKTDILSAYQIGYVGTDKKLVLIEILPLGSMLQPGTAVISGEKLIISGKFTICSSQGCQAVAELTDEDIKTLINTDNNFVSYMNSEAKQVSVPISNKGLKDGLAALKN